MVNWKKKKKRIPNRVQFAKNGIYEVVWVDDFPDGQRLGETRFDRKQIAIKKELSDRLTVITYLHECLHAISYEADVELTESQILKLEKVFYYLLKKNNVFEDSQ